MTRRAGRAGADLEHDPLAGVDLDAAAAATPGSWLELAVAADHEAVEAVSEILSRAAPGGTVVEPAFELVDEGLGGARGPRATGASCAPTCRSSTSPQSGPPSRARSRELGHLQAFGLRPIGDLDGAHRPRGGLGERVEGALPGAARRPPDRDPADVAAPPTAQPDDVVLALDPGHGVRDRPPPDDPAVPRRARVAGGSRRCWRPRRPRRACSTSARGPGSSSIAAGLLGAATVLGRGRRPDRGRGHGARTRGATGSAASITAREGSAPSGEGPFDVVLANLIASLLSGSPDGLVEDLRPGGTLLASGIFENREAEVIEAFRRAASGSRERWAEGDWVALEVRRARPSGRAHDGAAALRSPGPNCPDLSVAVSR